MDLFRIPIGLVPRATTVQVCVTISVIATGLGRLVFLGTLLSGNSVIYDKIYTALNSEESKQDISECRHAVTMTHSSSSGGSLYEECSWDEERSQEFKHTNDLFKEEIINDISQENFDERGQLYCHGDKRLYITSLTDNDKAFKEYDPNNAEPYKKMNWNAWLGYENSPEQIYCGYGTFLINSRALPIGLWIILFLLPFLLLTVLSNVSDLGFLIRHPTVFLFGNISHFQIAPNNICGSDAKLYTMSPSLTTLNVLISVFGMIVATIATHTLGSLGGLRGGASILGYAGYIASMVPIIGLGMSLRFVCMGCCFPWRPAYSEETNSLHYMKDNQLLDNDDPCLTMTVRSRGAEMTATLPPL